MPPTQLKGATAPDEKETTLLSYSSAVEQLVEYKRKELEEVKNQISTANYQLAMLRDKIAKDTNDLERSLRAKRQSFDDDMSKIQNDIIYKQNIINNEYQQQERITIDLRNQQQKFEQLKQTQLALKEDLVKLEGRKIEVEDIYKQAENIKSQAMSQQNAINILNKEALEMKEKCREENIRLSSVNDALNIRENKLAEDLKSYQTLHDFVEPKIRAIKEQQEALDKSKVDNEATIAKLLATISEEKILLASVQEKKDQLDKDTKAFLSEKEEYLRQKLLTEGSNATSK